MKYNISLVMVLLVMPGAQAQDYMVAQNPDSIYATFMSVISPQDNYGANLVLRTYAASPTGLVTLIRPAKDYRTAGYTQDSLQCSLRVDWQTTDPLHPNDSVWVAVYLMGRNDWKEGNNTTGAGDSAECTYDSASVREADWGLNGGRQGGVDRATNYVARFLVDSVANWEEQWILFTIVGDARVDSVFDYGLSLEVDSTVGGITGAGPYFYSDDVATPANRPIFNGWETAPGGAGTARYSGVFGSGIYGSGQ